MLRTRFIFFSIAPITQITGTYLGKIRTILNGLPVDKNYLIKNIFCTNIELAVFYWLNLITKYFTKQKPLSPNFKSEISFNVVILYFTQLVITIIVIITEL